MALHGRHQGDDEAGDGDLLPPLRYKPRRPASDRGLPPDSDLSYLAKIYLEWQGKLWPELVTAGVLPEVSDQVLTGMVEDYKCRHRSGSVDASCLRRLVELALALFGFYGRFSCDNSTSFSVADQLVSCLKKAAAEKRFIPWTYVFADFAVSGLISSRVGYSSYKKLLSDAAQPIQGTYIDDFTRASRNELEWWRLAHLSQKLKKFLIGASDGFDLNNQMWDIHITIYGLLSRLFMRSLREKVRRGMRGAAGRRTCVGRLPFGFTRKVKRDERGEIVRDAEGLPVHEVAQSPETAAIRREACELFAIGNLSYGRIARQFNERRAFGRDNWSPQFIEIIVQGAANIGRFIWNQFHTTYDPVTEKRIYVKNPRREWEVYYDPRLAIVSLELWRKIRRKGLALRRPKYKTRNPLSRNQKYPTTLFSGTLFCDYCDRELTLYKSGRYPTFYCWNGNARAAGCKLHSCKGVRIIESALLDFLKGHLLTDAQVPALVSRANEYLAREAAKPRPDTRRLRTEVRRLKGRIDRLISQVAGEPDEQLRTAYHRQAQGMQQTLNEKQRELNGLDDGARVSKLSSLKESTVRKYLADLRCVFNEDILVAAPVIRTLTGPIRICQKTKEKGQRGATWVAKFQPDVMKALAKISKGKDCPDALTLEILSARIWTTCERVEVPIEFVHKCAAIADEVVRLHDQEKLSFAEIARRLGTYDAMVYAAYRCAKAQGGKRGSCRKGKGPFEKKRPRRPKNG